MSDNLELSASITTEEPEVAATLSDLRYLVFQGMKGDTGDSAYEEAVALGFVGTEAEWIASLKGDKGDTGFSPEIRVTGIAGGHRVTITDATHPQGQSFDVMDTKLVATIIGGDTLYVDNMEVVENYDEEEF